MSSFHGMIFIFLSKSWLLFVLYITSVLATVPEPKNVTVTIMNFNVALGWDTPSDAPDNITYRAEFWNYLSGFEHVCWNITEPRCDFSENLSPFGVYKLRVRAELQGEASPWVETAELYIDRDTLIGAPTVKLISEEGNIDVEIQDPDIKKYKLRDVYSKVFYNIRYWKEDEKDKVSALNKQPQSRVMLSKLKPWTTYCVEAQVFIPQKEGEYGEFSKVMCERTTKDGKVEPWVIALVMLGSMVVVTVLVLALFLLVWYGYKGINFLFPSVKLPEHFKQYLIEPPHSYIFLAMQNCPQPEEQCHEVFILSENSVNEGGPSL